MNTPHISLVETVFPFGALVNADGSWMHVGRPLAACLGAQCGSGLFGAFEAGDDLSVAGAARDDVRLRSRAFAGVSLEGRLFLLDEEAQIYLFIAVPAAGSGARILGLLDPELAATPAPSAAGQTEAAGDASDASGATDPLTGLPDRKAFFERLRARRAADGPCAAVIHIELRKFKWINSSYGREAGDLVLRRVADILRSELKADDFAARLGGDEFAVLTGKSEQARDVTALLRRVLERISEPVQVGAAVMRVSGCGGATLLEPAGGKSVDDLLTEAEFASLQARRGGHPQICVFGETLQAPHAFVQTLMRDIETAIETGQFRPFFQIQRDLVGDTVLGAEVLARWDHPELGILNPTRFLPIAERMGLVGKIDAQVRDRALECMAHWHAEGIDPPHISINVTEEDILSAEFGPRLLAMIDRWGLAADKVMFELVESIVFDGESDIVRKAAASLCKSGFRLALDDFGTGRASIASLLSVPVSVVKIDRAFVAGIDRDARLKKITSAIIQITKHLGFDVLAEGVETQAEADLLADLGCTALQGHLVSEPLDAGDFEALLTSLHPTDGRRAGIG